MCEVTTENFDALLPDIKARISAASFVAFDCEFTSLHPDGRREMKNSLFDTMEARYRKLSRPAVHAVISQVGLAVFRQLPDPALYEVSSYNFYVCPRSFASVDERFVCQPSSLEFLTRYDFDFNKFFYLGISSLNRDQEARLRADLAEGALFRAIDRNLPMQDEDRIREICAELAAWSSRAAEGERCGPLRTGRLVPFVLHTEVRTNFPALWSFAGPDGFYVEKVSAARRAELEAAEGGEQLQEQLVQSMLGFTKVFRHLGQAGKPLVGHNCLLDLLKMFRQFEGNLPPEYEDFKRDLHKLFPLIFDTKNICYDLKKRAGRMRPELEKLLASSNLTTLHRLLTEGPGRPHAPRLLPAEGFTRYEGRSAPHEAGYDALLAGGCFLGLAHLASSLEEPRPRPLAFREKLLVLAAQENRVNVARAAVNHTQLAGPDPPSGRPVWLHVRGRAGPLGAAWLAERLGRWGSVDVRPIGPRTALVAVGTHRAAREILLHHRGDRQLAVASYSLVRHSPLARTGLWGGLLLSVGLGLALLARHLGPEARA
jgi:hypothetical protein